MTEKLSVSHDDNNPRRDSEPRSKTSGSSAPERFKKKTIIDDINFAFEGTVFSKQGTRGQNNTITGNMFTIDAAKANIHYYTVTFEPEITFFRKKKFLISKCDFDHIYYFTNDNLFVPKKLENEFSKTVTDVGDTEITIRFKYKQKLAKNSPQVNSMIGGLMKQCIGQIDTMVEINRGLYDMRTAQSIGNYGMDVIKGYTTTILPHEDAVMLTVNTSCKVMTRGTVLDFINEMMRKGASPVNVQNELVGKTVLTKYNNKTYKIDEIDFELTPQDTFERRDKDGEMKKISFIDYFLETYSTNNQPMNIRNLKQPLIISRPRKVNHTQGFKNIVLIPELCTLCGIPEEHFTNMSFKKSLAEITQMNPRERSRALNDFVNSLYRVNGYESFKKWGFNLSNSQAEIPSRKLDDFTANFGDKTQRTNRLFDFRGTKVFRATSTIKYVLVYPSARNGNQIKNDFIHKLSNICDSRSGLAINVEMVKDFGYQQTRDISKIMQDIKRNISRTNMVILILPNHDKSAYDYFKKECCIQLGIPSQVLLAKHFRQSNILLSVLTKVAVQLCCKLGGAPWSIPLKPSEQFMIVGMDTYHDSLKKGLSCAAAVASLDNSFTNYAWSTAMLQNRQEVNSITHSSFIKLVRAFTEHNKAPPTKVIIFRDGVGDGQVQQIVDFEYKAIEAAVLSANPNAEIVFLTLNKRLETRFFDQKNKGSNPSPGTVVDSVVTHPAQKDFYLVSLESRQGTVSPVHYKIHRNSMKSISADKLQSLAYMLSFTYFNWPGPIKVPSVCQYSHKLAYLVGTALHKDPSEALSRQLFFL